MSRAQDWVGRTGKSGHREESCGDEDPKKQQPCYSVPLRISLTPSHPRQAFAKGGLTKTSSTCKDVRFDIGHAGSMTRITYIDSKADCFAKPVACHRNP